MLPIMLVPMPMRQPNVHVHQALGRHACATALPGCGWEYVLTAAAGKASDRITAMGNCPVDLSHHCVHSMQRLYA